MASEGAGDNTIANYSQLCYYGYIIYILILIMEEAIKKLKEANYKLTKPRLAVLRILEKKHTPISARELYKKINSIDLASVYRALNLFESLHIVNAEIIRAEKMYCLAADLHHHIICEKCHLVEKVECHHSFNKIKNFTNIHHRLTLTGLCDKCH
ncbi:MAG: hypothetical protein A2373_02155 [Candidatus Magasanikbacteria bacterium RIFOXYB1_FULL_40_15]|uniref:Ferric uptake regulation protein n=1 Tax=Candidatus Magasanikbacteria bacterium RIFOXYB1_FULL_40_15 TaxID=1798697 RepID=A0A1F6NFI9_9BACT|nr:MAG: hypothetical protein A2373_02155 [Candidatus Magasanikbacteria bacterium RIFOXYB1_FULL_40_15]